jgi:hypothetical protein
MALIHRAQCFFNKTITQPAVSERREESPLDVVFFLSRFFFFLQILFVSRPRYAEEHSLAATTRGCRRERPGKKRKKKVGGHTKEKKSHSTSRWRENVMKTALRDFSTFVLLSSFV